MMDEMMAGRRKRTSCPSKKSMKLGCGGRFAALKADLATKGDVSDPGAVAASIGRKKYGASRMAKWSAAGRKRGK